MKKQETIAKLRAMSDTKFVYCRLCGMLKEQCRGLGELICEGSANCQGTLEVLSRDEVIERLSDTANRVTPNQPNEMEIYPT